MNKTQHIEAINTLVGNTPKLPKAFKEELEALLLDFKSGTTKEPSIAQVIEVDDIRYAWCNKHEIYEIVENFRPGKKPREFQVLCKAAEAELNLWSKKIHEQDKIMLSDEATPESAFEALQDKKEMDKTRKGTYSIDSRMEDIKDYDYDSKMIALGEIS